MRSFWIDFVLAAYARDRASGELHDLVGRRIVEQRPLEGDDVADEIDQDHVGAAMIDP